MAFWRLYYHLVWATKHRQPLISPEIEAHLYPYLVHKASELDVFVYQINGWLDHVHVIAAIPPKISVANVVKNLKGASSHFINDRQLSADYFRWQRGYGVLSLGEKQRPFAETYVNNQKEHHQNNTTNSWLEYAANLDEGPANAEKKVNAIGEPTVLYELDDEYPF